MEPAPKRRSFSWLFNWTILRVLTLLAAVLVTLLALYHAEENWRGKHAWENYKQEMEARGEVFDFTKFIPPPVPDDQNFAMTPLLAPLFDFLPGTQTSRDTNIWHRLEALVPIPQNLKGSVDKFSWREGKSLDLADLGNELTATNQAAPAQFLSGHNREAARAILEKFASAEPMIDELRSASKRPYSRFNVDYNWEPKFGILLPHLSAINRTCSTLEVRSSCELTLGEPDKAFQDITLMFHLIWSIRTEPFIISQLVRAACLTKTLQPIWEGLGRHQWSDAQLAEFSHQLEKLNFLEDDLHSLRGERSFYGTFFAQLRSSRNPMRELDKIADTGFSSPPDFLGQAVGALVPSGWFYFEELNYHRLFNEEKEGVTETNKIDPAIVDQKDADVRGELGAAGKAVLQHHLIASMLLPSLSKFEFKMTRAQCYANLADVACALERYRIVNNRFPENLDALVPQFLSAVPRDVIMGQPFKYRLANDGQFILYSVGWNKTDDGGLTAKETKEWTQGDWVWKYPKEAP